MRAAPSLFYLAIHRDCGSGWRSSDSLALLSGNGSDSRLHLVRNERHRTNRQLVILQSSLQQHRRHARGTHAHPPRQCLDLLVLRRLDRALHNHRVFSSHTTSVSESTSPEPDSTTSVQSSQQTFTITL